MKLYKYTSFSEYLLGSLAKEKIWLSAPTKFNDIFDCKYRQESLTLNEVKELFHLKKYREKLSDTVVLKIEKEDLTDEGVKNICLDTEPILKDFISNFGIYSLSEVPDSLLLWAHYAEDHRGVCLEYEIDEVQEDYRPMSVIYSTQYPTLSLYRLATKILNETQNVLLTKSMEWAYEKEWRILINGGANTEIDNPLKLTSVIFGSRMEDKNKETIKAILSKNKKIDYKNAIQSDSEFKIKIT